MWTFRKHGLDGKEVVNDRKLSQRGVIGDDWKSSAKIARHCAAFPIELPTWCMSVYSKEYDIIIDPFGGSGTTVEACINNKRNYICIEMDENYYNIILKRIANIAQSLF